jgi:hypothetical protein
MAEAIVEAGADGMYIFIENPCGEGGIMTRLLTI